MRSAILRGRDHTRLGAIGLVAEGDAAIALCKGGAHKTYSHLDPNEDATGFAIGEGGVLLAVADGHDGASGAEVAVEALIEEFGERWTGDTNPVEGAEHWIEVACEAFSALNAAVLREGAVRSGQAAPTTLSLALVRRDEHVLYHASIGDSHVFRHRDVAEDLAWATLGRNRAYFLGYESQGPAAFREKTVVGVEDLNSATALVLATDGVSERRIGFEDPATALGQVIDTTRQRESAAPRSVELARGFAEAACDAQRKNRAGDNIACAVLWLER